MCLWSKLIPALYHALFWSTFTFNIWHYRPHETPSHWLSSPQTNDTGHRFDWTWRWYTPFWKHGWSWMFDDKIIVLGKFGSLIVLFGCYFERNYRYQQHRYWNCSRRNTHRFPITIVRNIFQFQTNVYHELSDSQVYSLPSLWDIYIYILLFDTLISQCTSNCCPFYVKIFVYKWIVILTA